MAKVEPSKPVVIEDKHYFENGRLVAAPDSSACCDDHGDGHGDGSGHGDHGSSQGHGVFVAPAKTFGFGGGGGGG